MRIVFYSPDRHIVYGGSTPDLVGVGGGITARLRIATALAQRGHQVTVAGNVASQGAYKGVRYAPAKEFQEAETDVLVVHSSGGALDVGEAASLRVRSRARILLVSGPDCPKHAAEQHFDAIYSPSNFIARIVRARWPLARVPVFVSDCGAIRTPRFDRWFGRRHEKRMLYTSHPSKGLDAAIRLMRLLRETDSGYELHVYGGNALWGMAESAPEPEPGLFYRGLVGQEALAREYPRAGFAIHLQNREEPFGISLVEAMAAGCIAIASPTGSFPDLVQHEVSGYLVPGDPAEESTLRLAGEFMQRGWDSQSRIRKGARKVPFSWTTLGGVWEAHFRLLLGEKRTPFRKGRCIVCGGETVILADGSHCLACGHYSRGPGGF